MVDQDMNEDEEYQLNLKQSEQICQLLTAQLNNVRDKISNKEQFAQGELTLSVDPIHTLPASDLSQCLQLLSDNLGNYYKSRHGTRWKVEKLEEMQEIGLIYARFKIDNELLIFVSFMCVEDNGLMVVYVYELQILSRYRSAGVGTMLIQLLKLLVQEIRQKLSVKPVGLSLTCFGNNLKLLRFYYRNGFKTAQYSPQDTRLRSGRLVRPDYYILLRMI